MGSQSSPCGECNQFNWAGEWGSCNDYVYYGGCNLFCMELGKTECGHPCVQDGEYYRVYCCCSK